MIDVVMGPPSSVYTMYIPRPEKSIKSRGKKVKGSRLKASKVKVSETKWPDLFGYTWIRIRQIALSKKAEHVPNIPKIEMTVVSARIVFLLSLSTPFHFPMLSMGLL